MIGENIISAAASGVGFLADNAVDAAGGSLDQLEKAFGLDMAASAVSNVLGITLGDVVKAAIAQTPLPDFLKDATSELIDKAVSDSKQSTSTEAEDSAFDWFGDVVQQAAQDAVDESVGRANDSGAKGGNWLAALAAALGEVAGKHLSNAVELADQIGAMEDIDVSESTDPGTAADENATKRADQAREMTVLQSQMQAETQMFKMTQEATTTIIKSVGEALSSTARKQ